MAGRKRNERKARELARQEKQEAQGGLRAVGYLRVSTDEQAEEGAGLDYQRTAIREFAAKAGYELVQVAEDAGVSGTSKPAERKGFSSVLALAEGGAFDVLIVWKFDRLARSITGAVDAAQALKAKGVGVRSVTEPIDTTGPQGELVFALLTGMAGMERENIARRTWEGRRKAAENGRLPSGPAPYGYRREAGSMVIVEAEAAVVRRIYRLHRQGKGAWAIASILNTENVPTRKGGTWKPTTVAQILDQPLYRGTLDVFFGQGELARTWGGHRVLVAADAPPILGKASA